MRQLTVAKWRCGEVRVLCTLYPIWRHLAGWRCNLPGACLRILEFLNLNITSMRIRILRELLRAGGHMALSDMAVSYTPAERLRRRLERLEKGGQIMCEDGRWRLRSWQVLAIARCVETWRSFILPYRDGQRS